MIKKIIALMTTAAMTAAMCITSEAKQYTPFTDTDNEAVEILSRLGIINGYDDGSFRPDNNVTRAEAAQIIVQMMHKYRGDIESTQISMDDFPERYPEYLFTDVNKNHWAYIVISIAQASGMINGYEDGSFGPDDSITEEQIVKMAVSACGYGELAEIEGYPDGYIKRAKLIGLCDNAENKPATREFVAEIAVRMLQADAQTVAGFTMNSDGVLSANYQTVPYGVSAAAYIAQMKAEIVEAKDGIAKIKIVKRYCLPEYYAGYDEETDEDIRESIFEEGETYEISYMYDDITENIGEICHLYVLYTDNQKADSFVIVYAGE